MKKQSAIIIACVLLMITSICVQANGQELHHKKGSVIEVNGEITDSVYVICNDIHYVPVRMIFEKMGAAVFFRSSDSQILALSRDGDIIRHTVGECSITVNDEVKEYECSSILDNNTTYIPLDMLSVALCPDEISFDNQKLKIQKYMFHSDYHKVIQDVMAMCRNSNFYPERFQKYINLHEKMPSLSMEEIVFRVNLGLDEPFYDNVTTIGQPYELFVLVNKYHRLPSDFEQYNLVPMSWEYTVNDGKQYLLAGVAYEKFTEMADAARQENLSMRVVSAYRTEAYQNNLYNTKVRTTGKVNADRYSARPGFSEHQTGLAVDINSTRGSFEYTAEFRWLQEHAHEYGFILRYPKGKEWLTGYAYEPWHYRYIGVEAAQIIHEEGITYEEYYAKYVSVNEFK